MKVKPQAISKVLRRYKYCGHVSTIISEVRAGAPRAPTCSCKVPARQGTCLPPPLSKPLMKAQCKEPSRHQHFPPATSPADRRRCCVGCFAKMIDSFLNNCS